MTGKNYKINKKISSFPSIIYAQNMILRHRRFLKGILLPLSKNAAFSYSINFSKFNAGYSLKDLAGTKS